MVLIPYLKAIPHTPVLTRPQGLAQRYRELVWEEYAIHKKGLRAYDPATGHMYELIREGRWFTGRVKRKKSIDMRTYSLVKEKYFWVARAKTRLELQIIAQKEVFAQEVPTGNVYRIPPERYPDWFLDILEEQGEFKLREEEAWLAAKAMMPISYEKIPTKFLQFGKKGLYTGDDTV